jgi:dCMP deaminase
LKEKFIDAYMDVAYRFAELSSAKRLHVGAIVVKNDRIISIGYNGMPSGWDNVCEEEVLVDYGNRASDAKYELKTKPEVLHAETNAISKLAGSTESGKDAIMFVTHQPCMDCAKLIYQSGISEVYYAESYRYNEGVEFLEKCGVKVSQWQKTTT